MAPARRYDEDDYDDGYRRDDGGEHDRDPRDDYRDGHRRDEGRDYEIRRREFDDEDDDDRRRGFRCPFCRTRARPNVSSQVSSAGWTVFVVMILFCWPLFFIGLLMTEETRTCSDCGMRLG